jgi:hypothetical protein
MVVDDSSNRQRVWSSPTLGGKVLCLKHHSIQFDTSVECTAKMYWRGRCAFILNNGSLLSICSNRLEFRHAGKRFSQKSGLGLLGKTDFLGRR